METKKIKWEEKTQTNIIVTLNNGETVRYNDVKPLSTKKEQKPEQYEEGIDTSMYDDDLSPFIQDGTRFKFTTTIVNKAIEPYVMVESLIVFRDDSIAGIKLEKSKLQQIENKE